MILPEEKYELDEVKYTTEGELRFIKEHNESENDLLILAFVDREYAGNCSFEGKASSRRAKHRAGIGIALFQNYTGFSLGFKECGRIPNANKYDDGTYSDDILMVCDLR